jgi:hypothetical protein
MGIEGNRIRWGSDFAGLRNDDPIVENDKGGRESATSFRFDLLDPPALMRLAHRMAVGVQKGYPPNNWKKVTQESHLNHALMHIMAHMGGDFQDRHLDAAFCRLMMAVGVESPESPSPEPGWGDPGPTIAGGPRVQPQGWSGASLPTLGVGGGPFPAIRESPFIYLAHPYRNDPAGNYLAATRLGSKLQYQMGVTDPLTPTFVLIPHRIFYHMNEEEERGMILEGCKALVGVCRHFYIGGIGVTDGMRVELEEARRLGIPCSIVHDYGEVLTFSQMEGEE